MEQSHKQSAKPLPMPRSAPWHPQRWLGHTQRGPSKGAAQRCRDIAGVTQQGDEEPRPAPTLPGRPRDKGRGDPATAQSPPSSPPGPSWPLQNSICPGCQSGKNPPRPHDGKERVPSQLPSLLEVYGGLSLNLQAFPPGSEASSSPGLSLAGMPTQGR